MSKGFQQTFPPKINKWPKAHEKVLSVIREYKSKSQWNTYLPPTRMAVIIKADNSKCWEYGAIRTLMHCWWESKMVYPLETQHGSSSKSYIYSLHMPSNSMSRHTPQITENICPVKNLHTNVYGGIICNSLKWKWSKCPSINGQTDVVHPYYGTLFGNIKEWSAEICYTT